MLPELAEFGIKVIACTLGVYLATLLPFFRDNRGQADSD